MYMIGNYVVWPYLHVIEFVFLLQPMVYNKTCVKRPLKIDQTNVLKTNGNEGQKYCRMLLSEYSAILMICIKR